MADLFYILLGLQTALYPALHGEEYHPEDRVTYFIMLGISTLAGIGWLLHRRRQHSD